MQILKPLHWTEIYGNTKVKEYPDHYEACICTRDIFRVPGYEERDRSPISRVKRNLSDDEKRENREKAQRRARQEIYDIAACSEFTHFVTLTLDELKIERFDYNEIMKRVNRWLSNMVQRRGLAYVLIPERHKKGGVHFHGLIKGDLRLERADARTKRGGLFNWTDWKFGFSSVEALDEEYERAVRYVCKYISKGSEKVGGRWFLSGGKIAKPRVLRGVCDWHEVDAKEYREKNTGFGFKYVRIEK